MIASDLISNVIPPLKTSDTVQKVLERMADYKVNHLPIVNEEQFLGLLSEEDIIEISDDSAAVGSLSLSLINPYVLDNQHIYDVIKTFSEQKVTVLPVLDAKMNYLGIIAVNSIVSYIANITAVDAVGGIIILEINNRDNSLAHIAQIVESNNAQILSSYVDEQPNSTKLNITIKVNKLDISQIVASFLRYDYVVLATFNTKNNNNGNADRYDSLMNYLSF